MAHIFIIDDSELALDFTTMMLEGEGHSCASTTDPHTLMQWIEQGQVRPDLLIVDSVMPDISGPDLILKLRQHPEPVIAALPVLLVSALDDQVPPAGNVLVLPKPFGPEELQQALNLLLG